MYNISNFQKFQNYISLIIILLYNPFIILFVPKEHRQNLYNIKEMKYYINYNFGSPYMTIQILFDVIFRKNY